MAHGPSKQQIDRLSQVSAGKPAAGDDDSAFLFGRSGIEQQQGSGPHGVTYSPLSGKPTPGLLADRAANDPNNSSRYGTPYQGLTGAKLQTLETRGAIRWTGTKWVPTSSQAVDEQPELYSDILPKTPDSFAATGQATVEEIFSADPPIVREDDANLDKGDQFNILGQNITDVPVEDLAHSIVIINEDDTVTVPNIESLIEVEDEVEEEQELPEIPGVVPPLQPGLPAVSKSNVPQRRYIPTAGAGGRGINPARGIKTAPPHQEVLRVVDMTRFDGIFTNGDNEDMAKEFLTKLENLRPLNGKLVKTFGLGEKHVDGGTPATAEICDNIHTFISDYLTSDSLAGDVIVGVFVNNSTKVVTLYGYDKATTAWVTLDTLTDISFSGTYYHDNAENTMLVIGDTLRIFPGGVSKADGSNESIGIWIGYIDRKYFDGAYDPTAQFYSYDIPLDKPTLAITITQLDSYAGTDFADKDVYYYKLAYVYDGIQLGPLSDVTGKWAVTDSDTADKWVAITLGAIAEGSHNKRITAIRVYRTLQSEATGAARQFEHIQTIDLGRASTDVAGAANGAYTGDDYCYIPALSVKTFLGGSAYTLEVNGTGGFRAVANPGAGDEFVVFSITGTDLTADDWDGSWEMKEDGGAFANGSDGFYGGTQAVIVSSSLSDNQYVGGVIYLDSDFANTRVIDKNVGFAVHFDTALTGKNNVFWRVMQPGKGLYFPIKPTGTTHLYRIFDGDTTGGELHPLEDVPSIKINGELSAVIAERMWHTGTIVLDPGGKGEARIDVAAFSERGQHDVFPSGNIVPISDREGGKVKSIEEMFGSPVFLKEHSIIRLHVKDYPDTPASWYPEQSAHNIGCMGKGGSCVAHGVLYTPAADGIYRLTANNLAESDSTPTESLRVSEPINDKYLALTAAQKALMRCEYNQATTEVVFSCIDGGVDVF